MFWPSLLSTICLQTASIRAWGPEGSRAEDFDHSYRLPADLLPVVYDLKLTLDSRSDVITGQVQIQMQCMNYTKRIELSANPLFIDVKHTLLENRLSNETLDLGEPITNWQTYTVEYHLTEELMQGHVYYLSIWFRSKFSDDGRGLSRYFDKERGTWLNSLFEPYHARRLLPCFDEPRWRSVFKLQLWLMNDFANKSYTALSNTDGERKVWNEMLTIWTFKPTPPIPSYLFTIALGHLRSVCKKFVREICIWRFKHWQGWEDTAHLIIQDVHEYQQGMTDYLLADTVARLHLLIVPSKLNGMENFGLLNIKENLWPTERENYKTFLKTLYHEMAHQWFGNLVTVKWWDSIWLSESLTTFLSSKHPIVHDPAADLTTEPLVSPKWAAYIPPMAYTKGAAILEMLNATVGPWRMRRVLRNYLREHSFQAADTGDFLDLLRTTTDDIEETGSVEFLVSWLYQGSHPIVFVDYDPQLRQFLFSQTPKIGQQSLQWHIPIWIDCVEGTVSERLFWIPAGAQLVLDLDDLTAMNHTKAVAFNRNRSVYYELSFRY